MKIFVLSVLVIFAATSSCIDVGVGKDLKAPVNVGALTSDVEPAPVKSRPSVEVPSVPSQVAPRVKVNETVKEVEEETDEVGQDVDAETEDVDEEVDSIKKKIPAEDSEVHVATTPEPPAVEDIDNFEKIKEAVADWGDAVWGEDEDEDDNGESDDEEDEDDVDEDDEDEEEGDKKTHHSWLW